MLFPSSVLDKPGGSSQGTIYVTATVVKGKTFANVQSLGDGAIVFNDGSQLVVEGVFSFAGRNVRRGRHGRHRHL